MAYRIYATAHSMEFRGLDMRTSKKSERSFLVLRFEDLEGHSNEISCSDPDLFNACNNLKKGDVCELPLVFVSTAAYSFVNLAGSPDVRGNAYVGME